MLADGYIYSIDITYKTGGKGENTETYFAKDINELNNILNVFAKESYRHKNISIRIYDLREEY